MKLRMLKEKLKLSDFDYRLPRGLIAQYPCARREDSRLLVLERAKKRIFHQDFKDIVNYLFPEDCLVLNNTKVIRARMVGRRYNLHNPRGCGGGRQEIFFLERLSENTYRVLAKPAKKLTAGGKIFFNGKSVFASVVSDQGPMKIIRFSGNRNTQDLWQRLGRVPLPPYIKRESEDLDIKRYQTVYARKEGATACPTAGLHFTKDLLEEIKNKGVNIAYLTLHVNYGTFAPVKCEDITRHKMHREYFILPQKTKEAINRTYQQGGRVFAVGTTSARVLETCANGEKKTKPTVKTSRGWTDLFIYPPYRFKVVSCLLTNFHFPKSTLLMLISAFAGRELIFKAYQEAIAKKYRFFSYGDAMLIL